MTKKSRIILLVLSVLWTIFIFSNSIATAEQSSENSSTIVNFLLNFINIDISFLTLVVRKLGHFSEFLLQGIFIGSFFLVSNTYTKNIIYVMFLGLITAVTDEFIQLFSPGRSGMIQDVLIDFSGTITAVLVCGIIYIINRQKNTKKHK